MNNYKNLPATGYNSMDAKYETKELTVSYRVNDIISLSLFSIVQLLFGATLVTKDNSSTDPFTLITLLAKLQIAHIDVKVGADIKLPVTRKEVYQLLHLLDLRMKHCEAERDSGNDKFNPDTYIGQKLLLIDLREWLLLEEVEGLPKAYAKRPAISNSVE